MGLLAVFKNSSIANLRYNRVNDSYVCNVKEETDGGGGVYCYGVH